MSGTSSLTNGTESGKKVEEELKQDRPCHLSLIDSYTYSNGDGAHSVLALGYKDYWYSNISGWVDNNIYIRIADGWNDTPIRYVFGNCHGSWSYTTVIPS